MSPEPTHTEDVDTPLPRREIASRLRARIAAAPPGTLAELRRGDHRQVSGAFFRIALDLIERERASDRDVREVRWAVFARLVAQGAHLTRGLPLGHALSFAGVSEGRLLRLLQTRDEALSDAARGVVHQLVSKGVAFDALQLADLLLSQDERDEDDARRRIARDYYRNETR